MRCALCDDQVSFWLWFINSRMCDNCLDYYYEMEKRNKERRKLAWIEGRKKFGEAKDGGGKEDGL